MLITVTSPGLIIEFNKIGILDEVERFSAVKHERGIAGCTLSHYEIIKKCKIDGCKNVLIFELIL